MYNSLFWLAWIVNSLHLLVVHAVLKILFLNTQVSCEVVETTLDREAVRKLKFQVWLCTELTLSHLG